MGIAALDDVAVGVAGVLEGTLKIPGGMLKMFIAALDVDGARPEAPGAATGCGLVDAADDATDGSWFSRSSGVRRDARRPSDPTRPGGLGEVGGGGDGAASNSALSLGSGGALATDIRPRRDGCLPILVNWKLVTERGAGSVMYLLDDDGVYGQC